MVIEPEAFLLDEPFSALDANLRDQMRVEVKKLQRELETSMIFVTHDQEEAMTLGDRIVVMNDAEIMQIGSPNDIYNQPANLFVARFIGSPSTNTIEGRVSRDGDDLIVETDLFSFTLSEEQARQYNGSDNQDAVLGIRPEYLRINDDDEGLFTATFDVIENHGARDAVFLSVNSHDVTAVTSQGEVDAVHGDSVAVSVDTDHVWLFGPDGERLL
jgi:multiple sugar transport system ATP-binding protein